MYLMPLPVLAAATFVAAWLTILSSPWALDRAWMNFVFKPLATLLIIAYAWPRGRSQPAARRWVLTGLVLSLVLFAYATDGLGGGQLQYLFRFSGSPGSSGHVL